MANNPPAGDSNQPSRRNSSHSRSRRSQHSRSGSNGPAPDPRSRAPERIGDILPQLMARTGFHRTQGIDQLRETWHKLVGPALAQFTSAGTLRGGTLEVIVAHSTLMQELGFQKTQLLARLKAELPAQTITDLRFRVGAVPKPSAAS